MNWRDTVLNGKPFDGVYIFDIHGHIDADITTQLGCYNISEIVATLDRLGVDQICISSTLAFRSDWKLGNQRVKEAIQLYPGKVFGYAVPNPFYEDCDLTEYFTPASGFLGMKVHGSYQGSTPLNDARYDPFYELANRKNLPVLFHAWTAAEASQAADVAKRYPYAKFILGHSGMTDFDAKQVAITACRNLDNVFVDTAISYTYDGAIEYMVKNIGAERVLYGSDIAFFDCRHTLGKIALSRISDAEKEKILGLNAKSLFGV